jgi:hypothetical protein
MTVSMGTTPPNLRGFREMTESATGAVPVSLSAICPTPNAIHRAAGLSAMQSSNSHASQIRESQSGLIARPRAGFAAAGPALRSVYPRRPLTRNVECSFGSRAEIVAMKPKSLTQQNVRGQQGVNLVEAVVLRMHSRWSPTTALDMGIDGIIELCDPTTREPLNLVLHVQIKATDRAFDRETAESFEYRCEERDVHYWLSGNARVLLIVVRPSANELYWADIRSALSDPARRANRRVVFDKKRDIFTPAAFSRLLELARPRDSGIYLAPPQRQERLLSNLLPVATMAPRIFVADSPYQQREDVWEVLRGKDEDPGGEWRLKDKRIYSFHDLCEYPWTAVCDSGTVDEFEVDEWSRSDDPERLRDFVYLLNRALTSKLLPDVRWWRDGQCYAFAAPADLASSNTSGRTMRKRQWKARYQSHSRESSLAYFTAYLRAGTGEPSHYRHLGFEGNFRRYDEVWYLEITPTYMFTYDGFRPSHDHAEYLKGIKRIERNRSVAAQVMVWAEHLARNGTLFDPPYEYLTFGSLREFSLEVGLNDDDWLGREDPDEAAVLADEQAQVGMFADEDGASSA